MKEAVVTFFENMYYMPGLGHRLLSSTLLPLSLLYASFMLLRRRAAHRKAFDLPIVSVGNLQIGGSGKTPFVIALARRYEKSRKVAVVLRGYGRKSVGLLEVSRQGDILATVAESGDEAMLIARKCEESSVIVAENRVEGIARAIAGGAGLVILDDGFNRVDIVKFEIVLESQNIPNSYPLPSGPFREFRFVSEEADIYLKENSGYNRRVFCENPSERMVLATAIANPRRLKPFLPKGVVAEYYKADHDRFSVGQLRDILDRERAESILMTEKDFVKLQDANLPVSLLRLDMQIEESILEKIDKYIKDYDAS